MARNDRARQTVSMLVTVGLFLGAWASVSSMQLRQELFYRGSVGNMEVLPARSSAANAHSCGL